MKNKMTRRYSTGDEKLDRHILELLEQVGHTDSESWLKDIMITAIKLQQENTDRGDIKIITTSLKELRYAFRVFEPYRHIRKVAIFGSARLPKTDKDYKLAKRFASQITQNGWMVITGASAGIMSAGNEGAGREKSFGANIQLPFEQDANPTIADDPKLINFRYFFTRKLIFLKESHATVLCPGGFGTHDEGFETLTLVQTGKADPRPIVCLDHAETGYWKAWRKFIEGHLMKNKLIDKDDMHLIDFTHSSADAAKVICRFYKNYHSMRYINGELVFRIKKKATARQLLKLNQSFGDLVETGEIVQFSEAFPEEADKPYLANMPRLAFSFIRKKFGRLRQMIDQINAF